MFSRRQDQQNRPAHPALGLTQTYQFFELQHALFKVFYPLLLFVIHVKSIPVRSDAPQLFNIARVFDFITLPVKPH
jgi:hypothetical protein